MVKGATRAYNYIMVMYIVAFVLGIILIFVAIYFAVLGETILAVAFGTFGFLDLVRMFFFNPPIEIQNSRSNLAQLMLIITSWFADLMNLNTYISQQSSMSLEELKEISDSMNKSTGEMVALIEQYSENREA